MAWWDVLDVPSDADAKTIKVAYAKLLKENKPDENPSGFQQLHAAYKTALKAAKSRAATPVFFDDEAPTDAFTFSSEPAASEPDEDQPLSEWEQSFERERKTNRAPNEDTSPNETLETTRNEAPKEAASDDLIDDELILDTPEDAPTPEPIQEEEDDSWDEYEDDEEELSEEELRAYAEVNAFIRRCRNLMEDEHTANDLARWQALLDDPLLYDLQSKIIISKEVLNRAIYYTLYTRVLNRDTLVLLNRFFRWTDQKFDANDPSLDRNLDDFIDELNAAMPNEQADAQLDIYEAPQSAQRAEPTLPYANRFHRLVAYLVDVIFFFTGFGVVGLLTVFLPDEYRWSTPLSLLLWALVIPILESSKLQATPGMLLFKHKVVNSKGGKIHFFQALWRFICLAFFTVTAKFTFFLNIFFKDDRVLHDRCSGTAVIKREKTE